MKAANSGATSPRRPSYQQCASDAQVSVLRKR